MEKKECLPIIIQNDESFVLGLFYYFFVFYFFLVFEIAKKVKKKVQNGL